MQDRNILSKDDILKLLGEINSKLANDNRDGQIYLAGGASLALAFGARDLTYDIDAIYEPKEYMRGLFKEIADEHGLHDDWLNDGVKGFVTPAMKFDKLFEYSNLTVSSINAESLLAMKLIAARQTVTI